MKQRTSKIHSEKVIGIYLDVPYSLAKKVDKGLIRRSRRIHEKKEANMEIREES